MPDVTVDLCQPAEVKFFERLVVRTEVDLVRTRPQKLHIRQCYRQLPTGGFQIALTDGGNIYVLDTDTPTEAATSISSNATQCARPAYNLAADEIYFVNWVSTDTYELRKIKPDGTGEEVIDTLSNVDDFGSNVYVDYDPDNDRIYVFHNDGHHSIKPDGTNLVVRDSITFTSLKAGTLIRDGTTWFVTQGTGHYALRLLSNNSDTAFAGGGRRDQAVAEHSFGYVFIRLDTSIQRRSSADLSGAVTTHSDLILGEDGLALDVSEEELYYTDGEEIYKSDLDGNNVELVHSNSPSGIRGMVLLK